MWKNLLCAACLLVGSTAAASAQTITEPDSILLTSAGEEARVRIYRVSGNRLRPARGPSWESRDTLVATIHPSSGWLQAIAGGTTWVVATSRDGTDSAYVHVDLPVGPPPLLAPDSIAVQEVNLEGSYAFSWSPVDGAESYQVDWGGPSMPSGSAPASDTSMTVIMPQLTDPYEGWVCVNGIRGDEEGPDGCQTFMVAAAPLPELEMPTGIQLDTVMAQDTIFYFWSWNPVATADSYEWGAGPNDWQGGVVFRGPTWRDIPTTDLTADFHQVRDLEDYTSWVCVKAVRDADGARSENRCTAYTVPMRPADSLQIYLQEAPPEQVYLGVTPADTTRPDTTTQIWGWDDETSKLRMKAISLGLEFTLCSHLYWKDQVLDDRETTWTLLPQDGPTDLVIMVDQPSAACQTFFINPDHSGTAQAQQLRSWIADLPRGRER